MCRVTNFGRCGALLYYSNREERISDLVRSAAERGCRVFVCVYVRLLVCMRVLLPTHLLPRCATHLPTAALSDTLRENKSKTHNNKKKKCVAGNYSFENNFPVSSVCLSGVCVCVLY